MDQHDQRPNFQQSLIEGLTAFKAYEVLRGCAA